jgi:hypothetical protein
MTTKAILRRLDRLNAREMPAPRVLEILVTSIGEPDKTVELVLDRPSDSRRAGRLKTAHEARKDL